MATSLHCKEVLFCQVFFLFSLTLKFFVIPLLLCLIAFHWQKCKPDIGFSLMTLSLMRCEPSIANLKFRVFYLTPIEGPPGRWRAILERKANGLMDVSRPVRTKAQQQDLSDSENFIHNLNPPLQSASNNQFCATESSRGFWHTRLLIGGQYMEVSRLTENTFGQVNDPFCLSVFIPNPIFLKSSFKYGRFKSVRCEVDF